MAASFENAYRLAGYLQEHAGEIARWIRTPQEVFLLAPATIGPLTVEVVDSWSKTRGLQLVLVEAKDNGLRAYGEINTLSDRPGYHWLGHVVVRPDCRGAGIGAGFVSLLLSHAFNQLGSLGVSLIVFPENAAAIGCYLRAGMTKTGEEYHTFGNPPQSHLLFRFEAFPPGSSHRQSVSPS